LFNIIHNPSGLKADIICFIDTPFNESRLSRARRVKLPGGSEAYFSSAEHVILKKLEFSKQGMEDKHFADIRGMYKVGGADLDLRYLDDRALRIGVAAEWSKTKAKLGIP
jgi:hypothetical protein